MPQPKKMKKKSLLHQSKNTSKKFWNFSHFKNEDGETIGELSLYGPISTMSWWGDEVTPNQFREELNALGDVSELNIHIFSDGGDVFAGTAIHSMIEQYDKPVNAYIEGIAASIATVIPMAADTIYISKTAMMMVHNAMAGMLGYYNAHELQSVVSELGKIREPILTAYMDKTGKTRDEIIAVMDGDDNQGTWFSAEEAIEFGLADGYIEDEDDEEDVIDCIAPGIYSFRNSIADLTKYPNAPKLGAKNKSERKKKSMFNKKSKKKNAKAKKKTTPKAGLYDVVCPECGAEFQHDSGDEDGIITVTCPDCGEEFEWNTETDEVEEEGGTEAKRRTKNTKNAKKPKNKKASRSFRNATTTVTCPECDAVFDIETSEDAIVIEVTCDECGAVFEWETEVEAPVTEIITEEDEDDEDGGTQDSYSRGIRAERNRIKGLDDLQAAFPEHANIVSMAKQKGWTVNQATQRVISAKAAKNKSPGGKRSNYLNNMRQDANAIPPLGNTAAPENGGNNDEVSQRIARLNAKRR